METKEGYGRPNIPIDESLLNGMLMYGATERECAAEFKCSEDTIVNFIKDRHGMTFSEYRSIRFSQTQMRLKQQQIRMALGDKIKKTFITKRKIRRKGVNKDGTTYDETAEEIVPTVVEVDVPPDTQMLIWLGKNMLGQSDDAKQEQDLESLKARWTTPVIEFSVRDQGNNEIQRLRDRWVDQKSLPEPDFKQITTRPPKLKEPNLDELIEADLNDLA